MYSPEFTILLVNYHFIPAFYHLILYKRLYNRIRLRFAYLSFANADDTGSAGFSCSWVLWPLALVNFPLTSAYQSSPDFATTGLGAGETGFAAGAAGLRSGMSAMDGTTLQGVPCT